MSGVDMKGIEIMQAEWFSGWMEGMSEVDRYVYGIESEGKKVDNVVNVS